jgi:hypothetical protein
VSRPLDRNASLPELGEVDEEAGEFWVQNPFQITSSGNNLSAFERNRVFLNIDGTSFLDASFASGADIDSDSRAVVPADFNNDGAPDLLVGSVGGGPLRLFLNRFPQRGHRVRIDLVGVESNRPAIGARVIAHVGGRQIVRDVWPTNGGVGQAPVELILGVGQAEKIDRLTVRWPSGKLQEFRDLRVDSRIEITEGRSEIVVADLVPTVKSGS